MTQVLLSTRTRDVGTIEDGVRLMAGMLHRMRNVLTTVRGYAELLEGEDVPGDRRRVWAGRILEQLGRVDALQARLDAGTGVARPRGTHSLGLIVSTAVERSRSRGERGTADVAVDVRAPDDVAVHADGEALTEAIAALVDNALEASVRRVTPVTIDLATETPDVWVLRVRDDGQGMALEDFDRAGTAFFSRKPGHMGLGLYLTRIYLNRHDFDFDLGHVPGSGVVATIRGRRSPSNQ